MKDETGSYSGGLYGLALFGLIAAIITAVFLRVPNVVPRAAAALGAYAD
jgi:ACS family tartrate transporter-like MFS transporter